MTTTASDGIETQAAGVSIASQRPPEPNHDHRPRRRRPASARRRILGWYIGIMALVIAGGLFVQYTVLINEAERDVEEALLQEAQELRGVASAVDPATGQPAAHDVAEVFDAFLARNVPSPGKMMFTLVDGSPYLSTVAPVQLLDDVALVEQWAALTTSTRGEVPTEAGRVRYLAVPIRANDTVVGTFIVAILMSSRLDGVEQAMRVGAAVFASAFVLASATAWLVAGRVLRPLRQVTDTARSISETNWHERIEVVGDEEISELARTFNSMLDRLEQAFEVQRRFIDDAGHELRTPITIIRGHLELWGSDPAEAAEARAVIDDELARMARLVDELLLLAKAEHPAFLEPRAVDIAAFTEEVAAKARALDDRPLRVAEVARVVLVADPQRLTQAMMNLAANAMEHTPKDAAVEIGSTLEDGRVRLWVRDHGPGIAPEDQEQIFQRFSRGKPGPRSSRGAGLGLAIVAAIAEAHDGTVNLISAPGLGSTFSIDLPLDAGDQR
ncbi:MAG: HAMP domain-containing sensor histidine kinase [Acidimicrobiia bacterium]